jgi:hypothetical protein
MKAISIALFIILSVGIIDGYAACSELSQTARLAAREEYEKAKRAYSDMIPLASRYSNQVKQCISLLNGWTGSIGFKLPSIEQLLRMLCTEIRSYLTMPEFVYDFMVVIGDVYSVRGRYEVQTGDADRIFNEVWDEIWK